MRALRVKVMSSSRIYYTTGEMTNLFKVRWNDHLVSNFSLMHRCGINTNLLLLIFSRAEFYLFLVKYYCSNIG